MNKRELFEKLAGLDDEAEIFLTITYPKPEEGFTLGEEDSSDDSPKDDESDDDDGSEIDNEDGTMTEIHPISNVDIETFEDEDTNTTKMVAFIGLEMGYEDEDDDDKNEPEED